MEGCTWHLKGEAQEVGVALVLVVLTKLVLGWDTNVYIGSMPFLFVMIYSR